MRPFLAFSALGLVAAVFAACSGNGPAVSCNPGPLLAPPVLLYPIPGATGVPDSPGYLVVANVGPASGSLYLYPQPQGTSPGIAAQALGPVPSPAPSPAASAPANSTPLAAIIVSLPAGTKYNVQFTADQPSSCVQAQSSGSIGVFTTQ